MGWISPTLGADPRNFGRREAHLLALRHLRARAWCRCLDGRHCLRLDGHKRVGGELPGLRGGTRDGNHPDHRRRRRDLPRSSRLRVLDVNFRRLLDSRLSQAYARPRRWPRNSWDRRGSRQPLPPAETKVHPLAALGKEHWSPVGQGARRASRRLSVDAAAASRTPCETRQHVRVAGGERSPVVSALATIRVLVYDCRMLAGLGCYSH
mmetsp:Transcript_20319/g.59548  ORF Transcript_20319/g.59548 Transcript_20319/m.59548 type:complete len:208 (+) Transcript_20319:129-752(+)